MSKPLEIGTEKEGLGFPQGKALLAGGREFLGGAPARSIWPISSPQRDSSPTLAHNMSR